MSINLENNFTSKEKNDTFQFACKHYLHTQSLEKLRSYGRAIGVHRSAAKSKKVLIEDIVGVLSGRLEPKYTKRGAPVLNDSIDPKIPERISQIYSEVFGVTLSKYAFDPYGEYRGMVQGRNRMLLESPLHALRKSGAVIATKSGQLHQIDGVYYLLPLDCSDNGESVVLHEELVAQYGLLEGDVIVGDAAQGESAFVIYTIDFVNGESIVTFSREKSGNVLPTQPTNPFRLYDEKENVVLSCKYLDWLAPIRKGQRACIISQPKAGKSRLLQEIAQTLQQLNEEAIVYGLLVDQPPEAIGQFAQFIPLENLLYTTYDDEPDRQVFLAEFILNRAKRVSESGKDVVLFVDSFSGLAKAFNDTDASAGGKTLPCGLESKTLQYLKKYLGAAGCKEKNGSLTIIGTAAMATGNPFDEIIAAEIAPMTNYEIRLSDQMANKRLYPALDCMKIFVERTQEKDEERNALILDYLKRHDGENVLQLISESQTIEIFENRLKSER